MDGPAAGRVVGKVSAEFFGVLMRIDPAKRENTVYQVPLVASKRGFKKKEVS